MKGVVVLLVALFLAVPAHGQISEERLEQLMNRALEPVLTELRELNVKVHGLEAKVHALEAKVHDLEADVHELKTELSVVKATVQNGEIALSGLTSEVRGNGTRITDVREQLTWQSTGLLTVSGLLVTLLLWILKKVWDERRADRAELAAQQADLAAQQAEIARLRAENERLKPQIITERGGAANVSGNVP